MSSRSGVADVICDHKASARRRMGGVRFKKIMAAIAMGGT